MYKNRNDNGGLNSRHPRTRNNSSRAKGAYESGYDHGCDDSDKSYSDRYINEEGKGPSFHTDEFMRGYNAGVNCSNDNDDDNNDNRNHNVERSFIGTAADGYEEGRQEGYNDWNDRSRHNSECPPNDRLDMVRRL